MIPIGSIRIKSIGELLPPNSLTPKLEIDELETNNLETNELEAKFNPECVDLTTEICTTPIGKNVTNENRTKRTHCKASVSSKQKKETVKQTKLQAFFRAGAHNKMAPKKLKELPHNASDATSIAVTKPKRELTKMTLRRRLLQSVDDPKKTTTSRDTKTKDEPVPILIKDVIDLCSDSDGEQTVIAKKLPTKPKRPVTVKSEKSICPSYKVVEGTTFAVDGFKYGRIEGVTVYFLTHFHADHYIGLTKKFSMPIYCSKITANLMREFIPVDEKLVNIIPLNTTITIERVQITAIDANHCPGAVMLLFQLPCGKRILHTGDFRACLEMELDPHLIQRNIDILYLDTTYISNKYCFQSQEKSIADAIHLIRDFKEQHEDKRILFVCGAYQVGKEKFWSAIAKAFDFKVWTDDKRRKVLRAIDNDEILQRLVANARQANLHVISLMKIGYNGINDYWREFSDAYDMIFAIRPSGWEKNAKPQYRGEINVIGIEYSEHSSHEEMRRFVGFLKPQEVISTVPSGRDLTRCSDVPLSWYKKEFFSPIKKQASIFDYLEVKQK